MQGIHDLGGRDGFGVLKGERRARLSSPLGGSGLRHDVCRGSGRGYRQFRSLAMPSSASILPPTQRTAITVAGSAAWKSFLWEAVLLTGKRSTRRRSTWARQ